MTVTFIFLNSALELIPRHLHNHRLVRNEWKKSTKKKQRGILLDVSVHSSLVEKLEDSEQRGRPDIIHLSLLNLMYSPLFKSSEVEVIIHTRNDFTIRIPSDWRVPVNYNRFCGLFGQLLWKKRVPVKGDPLLQVIPSSVEKLIDQFQKHQVYLCENLAFNENLGLDVEYLHKIRLDSDIVFLIGAFQSGQLPFKIVNAIQKTPLLRLLPLYEDVVPSWVIVAKLIHYLEEKKINDY